MNRTKTVPEYTPGLIAGLLLCILCILPAIHTKADRSKPHPPSERLETFSHGEITTEMIASPAEVDLGHTMQLTIRITAPTHISVAIPPLENRLTGFVIAGHYRPPPLQAENKTITESIYQLTPTVSDEYRIAPMPITYSDQSHHPPKIQWYPTHPVVFKQKALIEGKPPAEPSAEMEPIWVRPAFRTVAVWSLSVIGALLLIYLLVILIKRINRNVAIKRMTPGERAMRELENLISRNLVAKKQFKNFYLELTMIVRRYIERAHDVRAPEQTTEEFLAMAARHPAFTEDVIKRLKAFLQAADLVKFAAQTSSQEATDHATITAREYIQKDISQEPANPLNNKTSG